MSTCGRVPPRQVRNPTAPDRRILGQTIQTYRKVSEAFHETLRILIERNPDNDVLRKVLGELENHDDRMNRLANEQGDKDEEQERKR